MDEIQRASHLFSYLQQILDETKSKGLYILTASNNFLLQENISQTLSGRIAYLQLLPLSLAEMKAAGKLKSDYKGHILTSFSNDCGIDQKTVASWLSILQSSYFIYLLKPYYNNFNKRIIKAQKLYFYDTGVACSLLGINTAKQISRHTAKGSLFENMMVSEVLKKRFNMGLTDNLYYWRDKTGNEVDLLIDDAGKLTAI